jgi:uncharacterized protein YxjI
VVVSVKAHDPQGVLEAIEQSGRFVVQQIFKPIANEYRFSVPAAGSTDEGEPLLYVKQKKMKIREDIRFRLAPDDGPHLFMIKSRSIYEFRGRHDVLDEHGQKIGLLEKAFGKSLLRSHWIVRDAEGSELFEAHEASWAIALVRRVADVLGDWFSALAYLPFNFTINRDGHQVGSYTRVLGKFRDRYVLELGPGLEGVDRRLVLAFAVALDALQDR